MNQLSCRVFLLDLLETEVRGRNERRRKRNLSAAHFPPDPKPVELFDPLELESGISESQVRQLRELNWIDTNANIVLAGPPGARQDHDGSGPRHGGDQQRLYGML